MTQEYTKLLVSGLSKLKENEFAHVPQEKEIEHAFSESFFRTKAKLLNRIDRSYWRYVNSLTSKVAVILITMVLAFSCLLSVDAVREKMVDFAFKIYSTFSEVRMGNIDRKEFIEKFYTISCVPETFIESIVNISNVATTFAWTNEKDQDIVFNQSLESVSHTFNSEHGEVKEIIINGTECLVCKNDSIYICYWKDDKYMFQFLYPLELGEEFMSEVVGKLVEYTYSE